jgi:hypothetical protein
VGATRAGRRRGPTSLGRLPSPPIGRLRFALVEGKGPFPLYKGGPRRTGAHNPRATELSSLSPLVAALHLSLFSPTRLPEGLHRSEVVATDARHHAAEFLDPIQTDLLLQSLLDRSPGGHR